MWLLLVALLQVSNPAPSRTMAVTIDDLPTASVLGEDIPRAERTTRDLLAAIKRTDVPAQSVAIVGREIAQTLLLHANALNAATFEALIDRLRTRGYRFVPLGDALKDPAYASKDEYVGPAGITWLHRWALTAGMPGRTFAGEPVVPEWVQQLAATRPPLPGAQITGRPRAGAGS